VSVIARVNDGISDVAGTPGRTTIRKSGGILAFCEAARYPRGISEHPIGRPSGVVRHHAVLNVGSGLHRDVERELVAQVIVGPAGSNDGADVRAHRVN